jgi:hypothetical protein
MKMKNVEVPVLDLRNIPRDRIPDIVKPVKNRHSEINLPFSPLHQLPFGNLL